MEAATSTMKQKVATVLMAGKCALAKVSVMAERRSNRGFHAFTSLTCHSLSAHM
jgi:hypothetical protein